MPNLIKNDNMTILVKTLLITLIDKTLLIIDFTYILLINTQSENDTMTILIKI